MVLDVMTLTGCFFGKLPYRAGDEHAKSSSSIIQNGVWNVRTMSGQEKYEMGRLERHIPGLTKVCCKRKKEILLVVKCLIYPGGTRRESGVTLLLDNKAGKCVETGEPYNGLLIDGNGNGNEFMCISYSHIQMLS